MMAAMFEGFQRRRVATSGPAINLVVGGRGAPLLLLHGYPQSHAMWHRVAPVLARDFTVVVPDLRGYGDSDKPPGGADHAGYAKRAMAVDQVEVMAALGFPRFAVAGHDRGARVAYRMALDAPDRVARLAVLDIVPTGSVFASVDKAVSMATFHWFFLSQPFDFPERLIGADPEYFLRWMLGSWSGSGLGVFAPEALAEYVRCFEDPATIHATCEDYRAGATVDDETDRADHGQRKIACPTFVLWGDRRANQRRPGNAARRDHLTVWREWAADVRGHPLPCGHFLPEERPDETAAALREFFLSRQS
jgi:haloacetate dehalogenase